MALYKNQAFYFPSYTTKYNTHEKLKKPSNCTSNYIEKGSDYEINKSSLNNAHSPDEMLSSASIYYSNNSKKINALDATSLVHILDYVLRFWQFGTIVKVSGTGNYRFTSKAESGKKIEANTEHWLKIKKIINKFKGLPSVDEDNLQNVIDNVATGKTISAELYNNIIDIYHTMRNTCKCDSDCNANCQDLTWCSPDCGCNYT